MIGAMTVDGGYNFDYASTSIDPTNGNFMQSVQTGETYDDIFPVVETQVGDERPLFNPDNGVNGNIMLSDRDFSIVVYPKSTTNNVDTELNKVSEDLKRLFFADVQLRNTINEESNPVCRIAYYAGETREFTTVNLQKCEGCIIWTLTVRYGQDLDNVRTLT